MPLQQERVYRAVPITTLFRINFFLLTAECATNWKIIKKSINMFNVSVFFDWENSHSRKLLMVLITSSGSGKVPISERRGRAFLTRRQIMNRWPRKESYEYLTCVVKRTTWFPRYECRVRIVYIRHWLRSRHDVRVRCQVLFCDLHSAIMCNFLVSQLCRKCTRLFFSYFIVFT